MTSVIYPRGSGGSWLNNLIWHLETANWDMPRAHVVFDSEPTSTIPFSHGFEIYNPAESTQITYTSKPGRNILFSCDKLFIHYLNNAVKVKYHIHQLGNKSFQEQLFELSNGAHYYMSSTHYQEHYCKNISLDYSLIFQDPEQFTTQLFDILNSLNKQYTVSRDYVYSSIEYYRSTCPNPADHFGNYQSILWLGYCHAITLVDQLSVTGTIGLDPVSTAALLKPYAEHCQQRVQNQMFEWKK